MAGQCVFPKKVSSSNLGPDIINKVFLFDRFVMLYTLTIRQVGEDKLNECMFLMNKIRLGGVLLGLGGGIGVSALAFYTKIPSLNLAGY